MTAAAPPSPVLQVKLRVIREPAFTRMTARKQEVCLAFGLPGREPPPTSPHSMEFSLHAGSITMLIGPSGSGKSSILHHLALELGSVIRVEGSRFPPDRPIVDAVAPRRSIAVAMEILTACGLGEPRLWIRRYLDLSEGEKFRASLARAIGRALSAGGSVPILCDEFCTLLHPRVAKCVAHNVRKLVSRWKLTLVAAASRGDILAELQPDRVIQLDAVNGNESRSQAAGAATLRESVVIEPGTARDYRRFAPMHYRHRDHLGFVDRVFLLRERAGGDSLGIAVFTHAPRELALRNLATGGRFIRNMNRLNRELRILRRLVMHPDVRGCGMGHWFVRQTLPMAGVRFVECLAAMGIVNPVFEKAGMARIGRCPLPPGRAALLERMRAMKLDPFSSEFCESLEAYPQVRRLVERTIADYLASMQSASPWKLNNRRPDELAAAFRQIIGEPPMYYLWDREGEFPVTRATNANEPGADRAGAGSARERNPQHRVARPRRRTSGKDRHHPDTDRS